MAVSKAKAATVLLKVASASQAPNTGSTQWPIRARAALKTSDTISKKPMASTIPKDSKRVRNSVSQVPPRQLAGACQMRSKAFCSSAKTEVEPRNNSVRPMPVASEPSAGWRTLANRSCTARAPALPIRDTSCSAISPRAASAPNTRPPTDTTMSISGASENSV